MKKIRNILAVLALVLLVVSCSPDATADMTLVTDGKSPVAYELTAFDGSVKKGQVIPGIPSKVERLPVGDVAIRYYSVSKESERVIVATAGEDGEVVLTQKESVPKSVFSSVAPKNSSKAFDVSKDGISGEYSFFIFNDNGTGWKTTLSFDVNKPAPEVVSVAIGWKFDGSVMLISLDGDSPLLFHVEGDVIANGDLRWEKAPEGEAGNRTLDGVWNLFDAGSLSEGKPSPLALQLSLAGNRVRLIGRADASGIPSGEITSGARADVEVDLTDVVSSIADLSKLGNGALFSENGGLAVINIGKIRIPLIRGNAESEIEIWKSTAAADDRTETLARVLELADSIRLGSRDGKDYYIKDVLALADTVVSASGKMTDISGVWKVGEDTWTTSSSISVSSTGRTVIHVPSRSGFHVIEVVLDSSNAGVIYHGCYNVEPDGNTLAYSGKDTKTATLVKRDEKTLATIVDASVAAIFGEGATSADLQMKLEGGHLAVVVPGKSFTLADATVADDMIGFRHTVDTDKVWEILGKFGIRKVLAADPKITYDVVFPLTADGKIELVKIGNKSISI